MGLTEEAPQLPEELDPNTIRIDTSKEPDAFVPVGPLVTTGPMPTDAPPPPPPVPGQSTNVRVIAPDPVPVAEPDPIDLPLLDEIDDDLPEPVTAAPLPAEPLLPPDATEPVMPDAPMPAQTSEIDRLLDEDRSRFEPLPYEDEVDDDDSRAGPVPWLIAIAVTVVLAVLAGILITRGGGVFGGGGGGDLPEPDEVKSRMARAFADMKSLKATYDIQKLNLYRVGREEDSLVYSFSNGRFAGSIDYDRAEAGYHQDYSLEVAEEEVSRVEVVQTADETRSLTGTGDGRRVLIEQNPPLGPPDGSFRPTLGILEDSLSSAARLLMEADNLEVVGTREIDGRELFEVTATVPADELSRADRIEAALDANRFLPVIVKRSISRRNAQVLGPDSALNDTGLDRAFAGNARITTELIELRNVQYDEIVLPGDLVLDAPDGVEEDTRDFNFERLSRAELSSQLDYEPLLPRTLPDGFEEQLLAAYTGEPEGWGPNDAYPAPESVFHSTYFDGKTTIAVTQRRLDKRFTFKGSPLQRAGIEITVQSVTSDGKSFSYGTSPEVPPHVFGFLGNTFVLVAGYAPADELLRIAGGLAETPVDVPSDLDTSPSPGATGSPGADADVVATPTPAATPAASLPAE